MAETRQRIVEATVELHRTVGPAATRVSEIADKAGVQRITVYSYFADEAALFAACSAHWRALHPAPDPQAWQDTTDRARRLRLALGALYAWYRETEPMTANVLRDASLKPALQSIVAAGLGRYLDRVQAFLVETTGARGPARERVAAVARAVVDFHAWRALAPLGDAAAADLAAGFIELAAEAAAAPSKPGLRAPAARRGRAGD